MANARFTRLIALCILLAACESTTPSRDVTEHQPGAPSFDLGAIAGIGTTSAGPFDQVFATEAPSIQQAATGGRATGHVGFEFSTPVGVILSEKYSFVALSTEPPPLFAAKGQYQLQLVATFVEEEVHGEVVCLGVAGNTARIGGRITKLISGGVQVPTALYNFWTVQDNGEGSKDPPDLASTFRFSSEAGARAHCAVGVPLEQLPIQQGNVQVRAGDPLP